MRETKTARAEALRAEGKSYAEIAAEIGTTAKVVASLLSHARLRQKHREARRRKRQATLAESRAKERDWYHAKRSRMSDADKAAAYYRRKCREAGVTPEPQP
jgi:DNA-binding CsgD family transcriptional regulator